MSRSLQFVLYLFFLGHLCLPLHAQNRPLRTADAEIVPPGTMRAQVGLDFLQDVDFPLSGLSGDLTSVAVINIRSGIGKIIEIQMYGAAQQFLDVKKQGASFVPLNLTGSRSTRDTGDFTFATKIRVLAEAARRPALAFRFGYQMPNSNQSRGIGTNSTNIFAEVIAQKHFGRLNVFGNLGLIILTAPNALYTQNDVISFGAAFTYPLHQRANLVGEVAGRHSTRKIDVNCVPSVLSAPGNFSNCHLIGTESRSQARLGVQIFAGGFWWDFAGIAGLTSRDPRSGFTFGISKDIRLFESSRF